MLAGLVFALAVTAPPAPWVDAVDITAAPAAVRLSGQVSDEVWQRIAATDAFVQREPQEGGAPSQRTEFRVAYDSATLFVRVRAFDTEPARIASYLTRRDAESPSDWIRILIDSFGHLNQTTVALTERVNLTMTPNLSLQLYAEPFVSAGDYAGFKELANGRSRDYGARYVPFAYAGDPDFNVKSFRTTNVLRWEYKPGSTLFVVWQQARENDAVPGGFRFGRDMHDIFGIAPRNVFLVKLAYWINY